MNNVEVSDLTVAEAVDAMVEGGLDKEAAHQRMRDAMRSFNCNHQWVDDGPHAQVCQKCGVTQVSDVLAYFGIDRSEQP